MSENTTHDVALRAANEVDNRMAAINGTRQVFASSFQADDKEGKLKLLSALNEAEDVSDHLDETINLVDYVAQVVEFVDENGEVSEGIRVIILDSEGKSFAALSDGLLKALQTIISVMGHPSTWDEPLPIKVVRERSRRGFFFYTVKLA